MRLSERHRPRGRPAAEIASCAVSHSIPNATRACAAQHCTRAACTRALSYLATLPTLTARPSGPSYYCHSARPFHLATLNVGLEDSSYPSRCAVVGSTSRRRLLSLKLVHPASSRHLSAAPCSSLKQSCHISSLCSAPSPLASSRPWRPSSNPELTTSFCTQWVCFGFRL